MNRLEDAFVERLPDRLLTALEASDSLAGYQVNRLEHSLQTATRAEADGADIEMIVGALIHDLGDDLAPHNHSQLAAAIIRPYVRAEVSWILEHHGCSDVLLRRCYGRGQKRATSTAIILGSIAVRRFCGRWDQMAFDPAYKSKPLSILNLCFVTFSAAPLLTRQSSIPKHPANHLFHYVRINHGTNSLITGANRGIGFEMTRQAAARVITSSPVPAMSWNRRHWWLWQGKSGNHAAWP